MKITNHIRVILGAINLVGALGMSVLLIMLLFRGEVEGNAYFIFFPMLGYSLASLTYSILNFTSKEEITTIRRFKDENIKLELMIKQIELRHRVENNSENSK